MLSFCKFLDKHFLSALHSALRGVENLLANGIHPVSVNFLRPSDSLVSFIVCFDTTEVSYGREGCEYKTRFQRGISTAHLLGFSNLPTALFGQLRMYSKGNFIMNQVQNISFHGQTVSVFSKNNQHYVAMKPIVENIGLDWVSQHKKIQRSEILNSTMVMMTIVAEDGKKREMLCLPLDYLNGWLFGVDARRVKPEIRERLLTYQRECFRVLNNHFNQPKQTIKLPAPANADILATRAEMHSILNAIQAASTNSFVDTYGSWDAKIRGMVGNRLHDLDFYQLSSLIQKLIKDLPKYILEKHPEILRRIKEERYDLNRPSEKPLDAKPKIDPSDRDNFLIELTDRYKSKIAGLFIRTSEESSDKEQKDILDDAGIQISNLASLVNTAYRNRFNESENRNISIYEFNQAMSELTALQCIVTDLIIDF